MCERRLVLILSSFASVLLLVACGSEPAQAPPSGGGVPVDVATAGRLAGRVTFEGTPPAPEILRMAADPACLPAAGANPVSDAVLIDDSGGVQNVFVYVKEGVDPKYSFPVPTEPVVLDQVGCRYTPRVIGLRVGQPLQYVNSDQTPHNVHGMPMQNLEFNDMQMFQGMRNTRVFTVPEAMIRLKCNVHNWMAAYVGVMEHPFFAVTDAAGRFDIEGLPPGNYTVTAWHERFGTLEHTITVGEKETGMIDYTFTTAGAGN